MKKKDFGVIFDFQYLLKVSKVNGNTDWVNP